MIDIVTAETGKDLGVQDTQVPRAANILSVQVGALEYVPEDFGIDLAYFLGEDFKFENASFRAYLIEVLANHGINVASVITSIEALSETFNFNLAPEETSTGLVAR